MNDLSDAIEWVRPATNAVRLMKAIIDVLPVGEDRDAAQQKLDEAAESLAMGEAQLAKALDYKLCQCTFPPKIMLSIGRHSTHDDEMFRCNACGKQDPSEHYFEGQDRFNAHYRS